jgi:hypothetical protein
MLWFYRDEVCTGLGLADGGGIWPTLSGAGYTRLNPAGIGGVSFARFAGVAGRYS